MTPLSSLPRGQRNNPTVDGLLTFATIRFHIQQRQEFNVWLGFHLNLESAEWQTEVFEKNLAKC